MKKYILISVTFLLMISCKKEHTDQSSDVTIGTQVWSIYNLDASKYRNGDPIPEVADYTQWAALTTGAWCSNDTYGKLYNWYAVNDLRGLAPNGWHIPSDVEWTILTDYLGGNNIAGGKMKALSSLWVSPNTGATNSSGFSALPGAYRAFNGGFGLVGLFGSWWSASEDNITNSWYRSISYNKADAYRSTFNNKTGCSVRCVRD